MILNLDKLNQLYANSEYSDIFLCVTYPNDLVIKISTHSKNSNKFIYLMFDLDNNIFEKQILTEKHVFYDLIECKTLINLITTISEKINDYIFKKETDIIGCKRYIKQYKNYKDIIINGKYDDSLEIKFNLIDDINYTDKMLKEYFKLENVIQSVYINTTQKTYKFDDTIEIPKEILNKIKVGYIKYIDSQISDYNRMLLIQRRNISKYKNSLEILKSQYSELFI